MKTSKLLLLIPLLLLLFTGCEKELNDAQLMPEDLELRSADVFHEIYEYTNVQDVPNPCTGEMVHIEAVHKVTLNIVFTPNGGAHLSIHDNVPQASAVGLTTGWNYIINYNRNENQNIKVDDIPSTVNIHFVSKGHVPGIGQTGGFKVSYKLTINGKGDVVIDASSFEFKC